MIWKLALVFAIVIGPDQIALKVSISNKGKTIPSRNVHQQMGFAIHIIAIAAAANK